MSHCQSEKIQFETFRWDLRKPDDCKNYLFHLQDSMQHCLGREHRLYWIIKGKEHLIEDLDEEQLLSYALNLALKAPYIGGTQ